MKQSTSTGHLAALFTIVVWGTTFISTKLLLVDFAPVEILLFRFIMGYGALWIMAPRRLKTAGIRQELTFAAAGLCGICLYYLLENIALTYTMASNVGVIISIAPFFTAILAKVCFRGKERLGAGFFAGFAVAMTGIILISFNGAELQLNPAGDLLAAGAALVWAFYSIITRIISGYGYPVVLATRRTFFYGLVFMIPAACVSGVRVEPALFANPLYLLNFLYLGLGASALCFVTWNFAVKVLGAVKTSVYIYMVPVITVVTSAIVLGEPVTVMSAAGTALTLAGLLLSEKKPSGAGKKAAAP